MLTVVIIHIMLLAAAAAALIESANAFLVVVHHGHHRPTKTKMTTARTNNDGRLRSFVHDSSFRKIIRTALDGSLDNCDGENEQNNKEIRLVPSSAAVSAAAGSGGAVSIAVCEHDSTLFQQQQQQQEAAATEEMNLLKDYSTPPPPSPPAESVTADLRQRTSWEKGTMGVFLLLAAAAAAAAAAVVTFHLDDVVWLVGHSPPQQQFLLDNVAITLKTLPETTWNAYRYHLTQNPIVTKALTSATVYAVGDVISQQTTMTTAVTTSSDDKNSNQQEEQQRPIVEPSFWNRSWDRQRTVRSMVAGGIGHGPLSHVWYISLDGFFDHVLHWTAWWAFLPKIVLDQTTVRRSATGSGACKLFLLLWSRTDKGFGCMHVW